MYSGAGGLDLGAQLAGFRIASALDADPDALAIHKRVFGAQCFNSQTEDIDVRDLLRHSKVPKDGSAILIGGPPCTAFSHAGFWIEKKRTGKDEQTHRIADYLRFVADLKPRAFVMENVPGLLFRNHYPVLKRFEAQCSRLGYTVSRAILNAADFGVPQRRRRLFVIGVRGRSPFVFPTGSFAARPRSAGWAIDSLTDRQNPKEHDEALRGKYASLLPRVPPGRNYLVFTERESKRPLFGWRKKYWSFLLKLHPDQPAPTIPATRITNNGPFHWQNRHLRLTEIKRLQSFPDRYPVDLGTRGRAQLGNAVPPLLSAQIMLELRSFLERKRVQPSALASALDEHASAEAVSIAMSSDLSL